MGKHFIKGKLIAVDTETSGLSPEHGARIFCYTFCNEKLEQVYIENTEKNFKRVKKFMEDPSITKVFHNAKYDLRMMDAEGIDISKVFNGVVHDTMIMVHLLDERERKALKFLARKFLNDPCKEEERLDNWRKAYFTKYKSKMKLRTIHDVSFDMVPRKIMMPYAMKDVELTMKLYYLFRNNIEEEFLEIYLSEMELMKCVLRLEKTGMPIDQSLANRRLRSFRRLNESLARKIYARVGKEFNINSNAQLEEVMRNVLHIKPRFHTEKGAVSFQGNNLERYDNKVLSACKRYRSRIHTIGHFLIPMSTLPVKGRLHGSYFQCGPVTGRFSSGQPNMQNVPRKGVRDLFVCPPGYLMFMLDFSQVEMRVFAHYSQDKNMLDIIHSGGDTHEGTALLMWGKCTDSLRQRAKGINFGFIFGMGITRLAEYLGIDFFRAKILYGKYLNTFPSIHDFIRDISEMLKRQGYIENVFGRRYRLPYEKAYKGVNYLVQGTAADLLKTAMVRIDRYMTEEGVGQMVATIHDELVLLFREEDANHISTIKPMMEDFPQFSIPIFCDVKYSKTNWEAKESIDIDQFL